MKKIIFFSIIFSFSLFGFGCSSNDKQSTSSTSSENTELTLSKDYISKDDKVLIIDDFLANGEAALGAVRLVEEAGAKVSGIGIVIEKSFQPGRSKLEEKGYEVYSLARVKKLGKNLIEFID